MKTLGFTMLLAATLGAALAPPVAAQETGSEYCDHYVRRVPFKIRKPGHWCLVRDLTTDAPIPIEVAADDVILDLNNYKLEGTAGPGEVTNGVFADSRRNVTVKNGTLRGFYGAVLLSDYRDRGYARNYVVENLRVEDSGFFGIQVHGENSTVTGNTITNTGGSTVLENTGGNAFGILMTLGSSIAIDNTVLIFYPTGDGAATGIHLFDGDFLVVGNRVMGGTLSPTVGLDMDRAEVGYRDNVVSSVDTPYVGGVDLGNNSSF